MMHNFSEGNMNKVETKKAFLSKNRNGKPGFIIQKMKG